MYFQDFFYLFLMGIAFGLFLTTFWSFLEKRVLFRKSKLESDHILQESEEKFRELIENAKKSADLKNEKKLNVFEKEKEILNTALRSLQSNLDKKKHEIKFKKKNQTAKIQSLSSKAENIRSDRAVILKEKQALSSQLESLYKEYSKKLLQKFPIDTEQLKDTIKKDTEEKWIKKLRAEIAKKEEINLQNQKQDSFFYLNLVLNRFDREYCPRRGIPPVHFKNSKHLTDVIGDNNFYLNLVEKECGVDIVVKEEELQAYVLGIDPVRRELGRLVLERMSKRGKLNPSSIKKMIKLTKKNLFSTICIDGEKICKKLRLKNVAREVQNMMGALKYRYSFAQNQYFHCEEVAWLCGLLNAEFSLPVKSAQRAGMFHDIGKAMDHSIDGNHAVIGADFISQHNEVEEVVHAVRAHHHDVTPSSCLAYLVIVADSISGSRPGARRFTEDSYNQKMETLERIIKSFDDIEDAYIMSAGREMRVIVDNKKVDDKRTLELSKEIARKIEKECSYPGLIKVTVVRRSEKIATTAS